MSVTKRIETKLQAAFDPTRLEVVNESHLHASHAGSPGTGESHFKVLIKSSKFAGLSKVDAQRAVMTSLKEELAGPVHALSLQTFTD